MFINIKFILTDCYRNWFNVLNWINNYYSFRIIKPFFLTGRVIGNKAIWMRYVRTKRNCKGEVIQLK